MFSRFPACALYALLLQPVAHRHDPLHLVASWCPFLRCLSLWGCATLSLLILLHMTPISTAQSTADTLTAYSTTHDTHLFCTLQHVLPIIHRAKLLQAASPHISHAAQALPRQDLQ